MWAGSWNAKLTVYTGVYTTPDGTRIWTGHCAVGSDPGFYIWEGIWTTI